MLLLAGDIFHDIAKPILNFRTFVYLRDTDWLSGYKLMISIFPQNCILRITWPEKL